MNNDFSRAAEMARRLTGAGGALGYTPAQARLLSSVLRSLVHSGPVAEGEIDRLAEDLGWPPKEAHAFLRQVTERDAGDRIIGVVPGLSRGEHPHRFVVNDQPMSAWCAEDTLFLPSLLGETATVESPSPLSRKPVRLTVTPDGVRAVDPPGAALSIALVDPDDARLGSVEAIWRTFCQHIHFFASREEALQWAAGRTDVAILTPAEGYELGRILTRQFLASE
jgi:alkylmercury lyase